MRSPEYLLSQSENCPTLRVYDENGREYPLKKVCGSGGQGTTYFVMDDSKVLVKIVKSKPEETKKRVLEIQSLCIPDNVNIAKPLISLSRGRCGYVMKFMKGMHSLKEIVSIQGESESLKDLLIRTSSYERRFSILRKLCETMIYLKRRGIVYCDLSPGNIFISKNLSDDEVWLIDGDNLRYENDIHSCIGTTGYAAPEISRYINEQNKAEFSPNTLMSDEFSFAVIAYKVLTFGMPFDGISSEEDETLDAWDCTDAPTNTTKGDSIDLYKLDWCGKKNGKNKTKPGTQSITKIVEDDLFELFRRNFEEGVDDPSKRPGIEEWLQPLIRAQRRCVPIVEVFEELTGEEPQQFKMVVSKTLSLPCKMVFGNKSLEGKYFRRVPFAYRIRSKLVTYSYCSDDQDDLMLENVALEERFDRYILGDSKTVSIKDWDLFHNECDDTFLLFVKDGDYYSIVNEKPNIPSCYSLKIISTEQADDKWTFRLENIHIIIRHKVDGFVDFSRVLSFEKMTMGDKA